MSVEEWKARLLHWHRFFTGKDSVPSANYKDGAFKTRQNPDAGVRSFWTSGTEVRGRAGSNWYDERPVAYLTSYVEWNGIRFDAKGFNVGGRFVYPDKDIMHEFLDRDCLQFDVESAEFVLTERGRALIAPFVKVNAAAMEAARAG